MKRLAIFGTGGTIAMQAGPDGLGNLGQGGKPLAGSSLLDGLAEIETRELVCMPSASLSLRQFAAIVHAVRDSCADGIVITHGTDTLEETGFALELAGAHGNKPVVLTGAMRRPDQPGTDGPANLKAAALVALDPQSAGKGVLVVMDDEIHWAPLVRKRHAFRTHAFSSAPFGPLGWVAEQKVCYTLAPARQLPVLSFGLRDPVVPILEAGIGFEPSVLEAIGAVADALVLSLPGAGHIAAATVPTLEKLAAKIPVVFASRTGGGSTLAHSYGYPGSESDLIGRGLIPAGPLDARKARILLLLALSDPSNAGPASLFAACR